MVVGSDLHGSTVCLRKLLAASERYSADAIVVAGDLTGKLVVPIVSERGGYTCEYMGRSDVFDESALPEFVQQIEDAGLYSHVVSRDEVAALKEDRDQVDSIFRALMVKRIEEWMALLEEWLSSRDRQFLIIPGNDDYPEIDEVMASTPGVEMIHRKTGLIAGRYPALGLGLANMTPWNAPRDVSEEHLGRELRRVAEQIEDPEHAVFIVHAPPHDTTLDVAVELDDELRPDPSGGMMHVGSQAVRDVIEDFQPALSIHGHVHESRGAERLGRTWALNPGSEYGQGILRGALVNLAPNGYKSHMFFSG